MTKPLAVGDPVPAFSATDQQGHQITNQDLIGIPYVLFFYPEDNTPKCTTEACSFRDRLPAFETVDTLVFGISPDSAYSHQRFADMHSLNFPLITDHNGEMCKAFGVLQEKSTGKTFERTTFVIDPNGIISWIERNVKVDGHVDRVLEAVHRIAPPHSSTSITFSYD